MRLTGLNEETGQIKASALSQTLNCLLKTAERSTRFLATSRGVGKGPKPKWLNETVDFTVTRLKPGSTVIELDAPKLRDTASDVFRQPDFWLPKPDLDQTSIDLTMQAISEACTENSPGDRFDEAVIESIISFQQVIKSSNVQLEIFRKKHRSNKIVLNQQILEQAGKRVETIPSPRAFVVSGILDRIEHTDGSFQLRVGGTKKLPGRIDLNNLDVELLRSLWGKPTTIEGMVVFKANGKPRMIKARRIRKQTESDLLYVKMPKGLPKQSNEDIVRARHFDPLSLGGTWPGDETLEELLQLLDSMK